MTTPETSPIDTSALPPTATGTTFATTVGTSDASRNGAKMANGTMLSHTSATSNAMAAGAAVRHDLLQTTGGYMYTHVGHMSRGGGGGGRAVVVAERKPVDST